MSDTNIDVLKELRKMNKFLEAIDWKLWNLHQQVLIQPTEDVEANSDLEELSNQEETETETESPANSTSTKPVPKYPSIEIIK